MTIIAHLAEPPGRAPRPPLARAAGRLAWPVVLSRAGLVVMAMVGVVMVGRYDTEALGALSLGFAVVMPLMVAGIGCIVGIVAIAAREHGAGGPDLPAHGAARPALGDAGRPRREPARRSSPARCCG